MSKPETMRENDELLLLLPWYATGKLSTEQHARVEKALANDSFLQSQLALIEEELTADREDHEAMPLPRSLSADALLARAGLQHQAGTSLWSRLQDGMASLWSGPARLVTAAALVLIVGQFLVMGGLVMENRAANYHLAKGQAGQARVVALVRFDDAATMKNISDALAHQGFHIVDGPRADSFYSLSVTGDGREPTDEERQQALGKLKAMTGIVTSVLPSN